MSIYKIQIIRSPSSPSLSLYEIIESFHKFNDIDDYYECTDIRGDSSYIQRNGMYKKVIKLSHVSEDDLDDSIFNFGTQKCDIKLLESINTFNLKKRNETINNILEL